MLAAAESLGSCGLLPGRSKGRLQVPSMRPYGGLRRRGAGFGRPGKNRHGDRRAVVRGGVG